MIRRARVAVALGVLLVAPLAACTATPAADPVASSDPTPRPSSPAPTPTPSADEADPCALLAPEAAEALAGEPMDEQQQVELGGVPACQMGGETRGIQVVQIPATAWAATVPDLIDELRAAGGGGADQAQLDEVAERIAAGEFDDLAACELFAAMIELGGGGPGEQRILTYVPDGESPRGVSAQSCIGGTYTSVLLTGSGIAVGPDVEAAIDTAHDLVGTG